MGVFLNQLPPTEVARLKAELAETLIAHFCYPRFYDYRANALRMRPVDRAKRQEVWQYLNAVDFNVWGRVDVDSPDFPRQVERLFIHFVQRNRNFFGPQGRRRMNDVRTLITSTSHTLAEGLRGHLRGRPENPPFGSSRAVATWAAVNVGGRAEPTWEQILAGTMQLQQQLQEARSEGKPASAPTPAIQAQIPTPARPGSPGIASTVPTRRPRAGRPFPASNGNGTHDEEVPGWPPQNARPGSTSDGKGQTILTPEPGEAEAAPGVSASAKPEKPSVSPDASSSRPRRVTSRSAELAASRTVPADAALDLASRQTIAIARPNETGLQQAEGNGALPGDEDVVIFEQLRHQLLIWLRVETVRSGAELNGQGAFQLVEILRHQDGVDLARLQVVSTLLNMCDQIITSGRATLFDYKQAMMFYLMHTRRTS